MRMASVVRVSSANGDDPFAKIKGLISDMIEKLEAEAAADAEHKAFCDKELSENEEKEADKIAEIEKITTKIDEWTARSAQLKSEVAALQEALAALAKSQATMDKIREEEKALYTKNRAEMEQGLEGVKLALKILNEYYARDKAHVAADGTGTSIIGLLEVIESDFSKNLAEIISTEEAAVQEYEETTIAECRRQDQQGSGREVQDPGGGRPRQGDRGGEDGPHGCAEGARRRAGGAEEPARAVRRDDNAVRGAEAPPRGGDRGPETGPGDPRGRGRAAPAGPPAAGRAGSRRVRRRGAPRSKRWGRARPRATAS